LAQPPDITETFVKEVDENMRRDQVRDFFRDNGRWIALGVVLFLAASAGLIWYQQQREKRAEAQVEEIAQIYRDVGSGNLAKAPGQLDNLASSSSKGVRATALLT
jgi:predicted negative regulator of RcsB-dependent stress response